MPLTPAGCLLALLAGAEVDVDVENEEEENDDDEVVENNLAATMISHSTRDKEYTSEYCLYCSRRST